MSQDERPYELVGTIVAVCARCHAPVVLDDWNGYVVGRSYGYSHCGLTQSTTAIKV